MKNIAIYTMGRAGTTWLADYIITNFAINGIPVNPLWEYWGENLVYHAANGYIELEKQHDWNWAYQNINQSELFDSKLELLAAHSDTVHLFRQSEHEGFSDRPFDYIVTSAPQLVCVNRQNKFEQLLSTFIAKDTGTWNVWDQESLDQYLSQLEKTPIVIDVARAQNWCKTYLIFNQRKKRLIEAGLLIANLTYETLHTNLEVATKRMLKDRGVDSPIIIKPTELENSTLKLSTVDQKHKLVANFDQLKEWFDQNSWQSRLSAS